ncbi:MAG: hypothetical protein D6758_00500 [Gammaproteobacteria bacterium]|nr:MAG: hypothetical protein D6758_00500 [Gammaproteobacteria bacterium]
MLVMKYEDWSLIHEVVDPRDMYTQIDLTGIERLLSADSGFYVEQAFKGADLASLSCLAFVNEAMCKSQRKHSLTKSFRYASRHSHFGWIAFSRFDC